MEMQIVTKENYTVQRGHNGFVEVSWAEGVSRAQNAQPYTDRP
jgi:hypothetical protein